MTVTLREDCNRMKQLFRKALGSEVKAVKSLKEAWMPLKKTQRRRDSEDLGAAEQKATREEKRKPTGLNDRVAWLLKSNRTP